MDQLLVESAIRGTLIAACVGGIVWAARIKVPALLHAVWTGALIAMLVMPLWILWGPKASLTVLPAPPSSVEGVVQFSGSSLAEGPSTTGITPLRVNRARPVDRVWNRRDTVLVVYAMVALALLARLAIGTLTTWALRRRSVLRAGRLTSRACASPVTVGWIQPVVILPQRWEEWPESHLDAVLTHEHAHVRRRDPLVQWLALFNRALFWFHPVAWWLERRLSALAEQSCDDAVLARGHDPQDYSEYLLESARAVGRARVNLAGVFMPGSYLPQRIRRILDRSRTRRVSRARLACVIAAAVIAVGFSAAATLARAVPQGVDRPRMVVRPVQPRSLPSDSPAQPVSLEWLDGDEWAFEVQSIITSNELRDYAELKTPQQRDAFIERFWARRDPTPGTPANEFQEEFGRRVKFARERLTDPQSAGMLGVDTDRGRIYLMFGPPDSIESRTVANGVDEVWHYKGVAGFGGDLSVRFLPSRGSYCGYRIVAPAPAAPKGDTPLQLYPLGLIAIDVAVDATRVVGAGWDLYNGSGLQVDHGQIGFLNEAASADTLSQHLSSTWLEGGIGCTHVLPPDTYTLTTAVRSTTGEVQRLKTTFRVQ